MPSGVRPGRALAPLPLVVILACADDPAGPSGPPPVLPPSPDAGAPADGCALDADCPFGQVCAAGRCEASLGLPSDRGCWVDADCAMGTRCAASTGRCVAPPDLDAPPDTQTATCADGAHRQCGRKLGACAYGVERCEDGRWSGRCEGGVRPRVERCDGADDDCDGEADEGFGLGAACVAGDGACRRGGVTVCAVDSATTTCSASADPGGLELCGNGVDDDCDGETDEGFELGAACTVGTGACERTGAVVCGADGLGTACSATAGAAEPEELCGGAEDEDCDGQREEGFEALGTTCEVGVGACRREGEWVCSPDRRALRCSATAGTAGPVELCGNADDDDCDGQTNEGFESLGASCSVGAPPCQTPGTFACSSDLRTMVCATGAVGAELCNGADDDRDTCVDEGFDVGVACSVGVGSCARSGLTRCAASGTDVSCSATPGTPSAAGELCGNGLDDDCDGHTDEGFPDLNSTCAVGRGICQRSGARVCASDGRSTTCDAVAGSPNAAGELCGNGLDDDCDGQTDEGFATLGGACSVGQGACRRSGQLVCSADGLGVVCSARAGTPGAAELCGNSVDDDCDGQTDEGFAALGTACSAGTGVCARAGLEVCSGDSRSLVCSAQAGAPDPGGELCGNGLDDDCDGQTDEGFPGLGTACSAGAGVCLRAGTRVCSADRTAVVCGATPAAPTSAELCGNALDDDCDGQTDEGFPSLGTACSAGAGVCLRTGARVCSADRTAVVCDATPGTPTTGELCGNALDDDCDGQTDEGFPGLGTACSVGAGVCLRSGARVCSTDRTAVVCGATAGSPNAAGELCGNTLDDDCDGQTDEGYPTVGQACAVGAGACRRTGAFVCSSSRLSTECSATAGTPSAESCNDVDDDCNGTIDNGCDDDGDDFCDAAMSFPLGPSASVAVCPNTTSVSTRDCNDNDRDVNPAEVELCGDAIDQNCDGDPSDGCASCSTGIDADFDGSNQCLDCDDSDGSIRPGAAERCDGVDNDCDGAIDEGFDADTDGYTTCGTVVPGGGLDSAWVDCDDARADRHPFACELCAMGSTSNTVACGAANDRGNGVDEDCDGYADELCRPCSTSDADGDGISECDGDCEPANAAVAPNKTERCDGLDTDCNATTTDNCDVSDPCNWPGAPAPDVCRDRLLCVESLGPGGQSTGDFTCTSLCNGSPLGLGLGDGCQPNQTCSAHLTPSGNLHGCAVATDIGPGAVGASCSDGDDCRSGDCLRDSRTAPPARYCSDLCGSDAYCGGGTNCQITGSYAARCLRTLGSQSRGLGTACNDTALACRAGSLACVQIAPGNRICTSVCCSDGDCPAGYFCSLEGGDTAGPRGGYDTVPVCWPEAAGAHDRPAGAACTANGQCESEFCDVNLGICVSTCCNDSDCPLGLSCEMTRVDRGTDRISFVRMCLNLVPTDPLEARP